MLYYIMPVWGLFTGAPTGLSVFCLRTWTLYHRLACPMRQTGCSRWPGGGGRFMRLHSRHSPKFQTTYPRTCNVYVMSCTSLRSRRERVLTSAAQHTETGTRWRAHTSAAGTTPVTSSVCIRCTGGARPMQATKMVLSPSVGSPPIDGRATATARGHHSKG